MGCRVGNFAFNSQHELVHAQAVTGQAQTYFCVHCGGGVRARKSKRGQLFFVHDAQRKTKQTHDFTEHRRIQAYFATLLQSWGIDYKIEYAITPGIRADIWFAVRRGKKVHACVIEVQRSPISLQEIDRRIAYYEAKHIVLIWILPKRMSTNMRLTLWQQYLLMKTRHILFYDAHKAAYYYVSDYLKYARATICVRYQKYNLWHLQAVSQNKIRLSGVLSVKIPQLIFEKERIRWEGRQLARRRRSDALTRALYRTQLRLKDLPTHVYNRDIKFLNSYQSVFWMQALLYLLLVKEQWNARQIIAFCVQQRLLVQESDTTDINLYIEYVKRQ